MSDDKLLAYYRVHAKIYAIKATRLAFGFGLRQSKDIVEAIYDQKRPLLLTYEMLGRLTAAIVASGMTQQYDYSEQPAQPVNCVGPCMVLERVEGPMSNPINMQEEIDKCEADKVVTVLGE